MRKLLEEFFENKIATFALFIVLVCIFLVIFAPWITPQNPYDLAVISILNSTLAPGEIDLETGKTFLLGTDPQGRDMLSAIIYGMRISLVVAVTSTVVSVIIGIIAGITAAYVGGRVESLIMRLVDFVLSFPTILVALILLAILGRGVDKVILALVLVQWAYYARTVRGSALVEKNREYIEAAHSQGLPHLRIVFRHLLPNCLPPLIVVATIQVGHAIAVESTLSFLGVGVPITEPSLGMLISSGYQYMLSGKTWISVYPGIALLIMIVAINLVGDRMRDILNPRLKK